MCDTSRAPAVCVNARYAGMLPQIGDALSGVRAKLAGVRNLPVRWADHGDAPRAGEAALPAVTPLGWAMVRGRLTDPERYAWEAVGALALRGDCPQDRLSHRLSDRLLTADDAVAHYLAPDPVRDRLDGAAAGPRRARAELAAMDGGERRAWLSAYFAARAACRPQEVPAL
ncbi:hypothetical protein ACIQVT_05575 [Streptomyces sp. NPDC100445]|uniref:hypothetical protein n=1 Tax=Streptomyces sp. NPDC100445 TaxID=3366102 RepID=UPI0037F9DB4D